MANQSTGPHSFSRMWRVPKTKNLWSYQEIQMMQDL